jgi:dienelactone hydrolase
MRRPTRRLLAFLVVGLALAVVVFGWMAPSYLRAASLVVRSAGLEQSHPWLAAWQRQSFVERDLAVPTRRGWVRARAYEPGRPALPPVLLVPGVNAMAIDEPRLIGFARQLAATGITVVTPEIPDLKRYLVTPGSTDQIEDAAGWLARDARLCPGGRAGLIGISFAGGLSVVAAGRPSVADRLAFVVSFGGHADFQRVVRYLCTGLEPHLAAGETAGAAPADVTRRPPHDYGVAVMLLDLAGEVVPAAQAEPLRRAVLVFLAASHLALYDAVGADREFARAQAMEATLPEPAATYLHLVNTRDVDRLGARLLPFASALGDDPALSPERSPAPHAPVFLLHGADDNVVPAAESRLLAHHLQGKVAVRLLLSRLITHAEVNRQASAFEAWQLIGFWAGVLRE